MKEVGSIIIGTKVDNKGLKDGLKDVKTELDNFDKDSKVEIETDTKIDNSATLESLKKERDSLAKSQEALNKRIVVSDYVNESFNKQLRTLDEQIAKLEQVDNITDDVKITYSGIEDELNDINSTLDNTEQKTNEIQLEPFNGSLDEAKEKLEEVQQEIIRLQAEQDKLLAYEDNIDGVKVSYSQGMIPGENEETYNKIQQQLDVLRAKEEQYTNQIRFSNEEIERQAELKRKSSSIQDNITPRIDVEPYTAQLNYLKTQMDELREKAKYMSPDDEGLIKIRAQYAKISQQYDRLLEKQQKFNQNNISSSASLKSVSGTLDKMNNKMSVLARKAVGWGMAIFGVRTAYMAIRQAMNTLSEYDTHLANTISSVKLALTSAIEPVIRRIIDLVITLINYLNYLTTAWFGLNIFARASELSTKKTADNLKGAVGSAKALNKEMKQLASFDEMNILQDNTSSGGGGGTGGASGIETPEFDLPITEIPEWLRWLADHGDLVRLILEGIATALLMIKGHLSLIQGLGIFLIIDGVVKLIKDLKTYLEDRTWYNFAKVLADVSEILLGLALLAGITTPLGLISAILSQIVSMIAAIPSWIENIIRFIKDPSWDNYLRTIRSGIDATGLVGRLIGWILDKLGLLQPQIKLTEEAERDLKTATEELTSAQDLYVSSVDRAEDAQRKLNEAQQKTGLSGEDLFNKVQQGVLDYKDMTAEQKEVYKAYLNNVNAQNNLKDATDKLTEAKHKEKIASLENSLAVAKEKGNYDEYKQAVVDAFNKGEISSEEARQLIGKAMSGMSEDSKKTFTKDLPDNVKEGLDPKKYDKNANELRGGMLGAFGNLGTEIGQRLGDALGGALKTAINKVLAWIEGQLNRPVDAINGLIGVINAIPGVSIGRISRIKLPRLAKGTILNAPGKGVPVAGGSAIAGEAGREAYLPLSDTQLLEELGSTIGKYVVINLTNINQMNGRVISRELKRMENESDFAFNR